MKKQRKMLMKECPTCGEMARLRRDGSGFRAHYWQELVGRGRLILCTNVSEVPVSPLELASKK